VVADAPDHVPEIRERVQAVAFGRDDQAVEHGGGVSAVVAAEEHVVVAADGDRPDGPLGVVVVDAQFPRFGIADQCLPGDS